MTQAMAQVPASPGELYGDPLQRSRTPSAMTAFGHWLADTLNHAFGNPREEGAHQPPLVGVQPYRDRPRRRRHI